MSFDSRASLGSVDTVEMNTIEPRVPEKNNGEIKSSDIYRLFNKRQCSKFIKAKNGSVCYCNRPIEWHLQEGVEVTEAEKEVLAEPEAGEHAFIAADAFAAPKEIVKWSVEDATDVLPTDAYGIMEFEKFGFVRTGQNPKYIRVDTMSTEMRMLWKLLTKTWGIEKPELLVSVTGGAKKMQPMSGKMMKKLKQGLVNIATKTKTWIVTGGFNIGVNQLVGEAIRDYLLAGGGDEDLVLIGIAAWGSIYNNHCLQKENQIVCENDDDFPKAVYYNAEEEVGKGQAVLEPHHTHFILCDDGTHSQFGSEIAFRSRFEQFVTEQMKKRTITMKEDSVKETNTLQTMTPRVHLIIEGGKKDIHTALLNVQSNIPVVVVWGSGRAANLLAEVCLSEEDFTREELDDVIEKHLPLLNEEDKDEILGWLMEMLAGGNEDLLHVYQANSTDPNQQLDKVILHAFLNSRKNQVSTTTQLRLAMAWNRPDVAATEIFGDQNKARWEKITASELETCLLSALRNNQTEFVELFLDHGINFASMLNRESLAALYFYIINKSDPDMIRLRQRLDYLNVTWCDWLFSLSKNNGLKLNNRVQQSTQHQNFFLHTIGKYISSNSGHVIANFYPKIDSNDYLPEDLFLWALVLQRIDLAKLLWRQVTDHMCSALVAATILRNLNKSAENEGELEIAAKLEAGAVFFETTAVDVLTVCYQENKRKTLNLLVRRNAFWSGQTLMTLADQGESMDFMSHTAVQTKLSQIWTGGMNAYLPLWRILFCMFMPLLIPQLIFHESQLTEDTKRDIETATQTDSIFRTSTLNKKSVSRKKSVRTSGLSASDSSTSISFFMAIYFFYSAPITKFIFNLLSALLFLVFFSYIVLVTLRHSSESKPDAPQPSYLEYILLGWAVSLIAEEIRQILTRSKLTLLNNLKDWLTSSWDLFDLLICIMLIVCILTRALISQDYFVWVRMTYALTLAMYYVRFMEFYYIHQTLGPKVVMVARMMSDIVFFLALLAVFILAYGVAAQSLLYPNSQLSWKLLKDIVYLPYWQMYGELALDDIEGDDDKVGDVFKFEGASAPFNGTLINESQAQHNALVIILFAIYMLVTNVLLLNLLIAMFGYTFEQVQSSSLKVWAFHRFSLIYEYYYRPFLCPPLTSISHLISLIRFTCIKIQNKEDDGDGTEFKRSFDGYTNRMLTAFAQQCTDKYLSTGVREDVEPLDEKSSFFNEKMEDLRTTLEVINNRLEVRNRAKTQRNVKSARMYRSNSVTAVLDEPPSCMEEMEKLNKRMSKIENKLNAVLDHFQTDK